MVKERGQGVGRVRGKLRRVSGREGWFGRTKGGRVKECRYERVKGGHFFH